MFVFLVLASAASAADLFTTGAAPLKQELRRYRRRAGTTRVKPAPSTELPYDSSIENGLGWNHNTEQFAAHAFEPYTAPLRQLDTSLGVQYLRKVIKSTSQYSDAMRTTAHVSAGGWGMKLKASFGFGRSESMTSKDALFLLHASKQLGFEGWSFADVPDLLPEAKAQLCKQGVFTPEKFENIYGTYYVRGLRKATALDVFVKVSTETSKSSRKISAGLEASWSGFGVSVAGGFSFSDELTREHSSSSISVSARAYGVNREWIPKANMDNLDQILQEYEDVSSDGSGIALTLSRYDDHRDYIKIQNECGSTFESLERDEFWMDKYVDLAVEAKLFAEEVLATGFEQCAAQLTADAFQVYDDLVETPEDQLNAEGFTRARERFHEIASRWDADNEICRDAELRFTRTVPSCNEEITGDGESYRGCQSYTVSGKKCQRWTSQSPHKHSNTPGNRPMAGLGNHNYCRNPDGEDTIWCYTEEGRRWESCSPINKARAGALWRHTPNAAITGDREALEDMTVDGCKQTCNNRSWCKSFDYNKHNRKCDLQDRFSSDTGLKTDYEGNPWDHYDRLDIGQTVDYVMLTPGSTCGDLGDRAVIRTKEECTAALRALEDLGHEVGNNEWEGTYDQIPSGCSMPKSGEQPNPHFNHLGGFGVGRADLRPICRA